MAEKTIYCKVGKFEKQLEITMGWLTQLTGQICTGPPCYLEVAEECMSHLEIETADMISLPNIDNDYLHLFCG